MAIKYLDYNGLSHFLDKLDERYVDKTNNQTIGGIKTFSGGLNSSGTTTLTGTVYLNASTPFLINNNREGRVGMRAANSSNVNLAQINVAPASAFDASKYSGYVWQISASGVTNSAGTATGESRASLRVSTYGLEFRQSETAEFQNVAMIGDIPTKTSDLTNDSGYITNSALSGYVPTSRTINGKALSNDITLSASDVGALSSSTSYVSSVNGSSGAITNVAKTNSDNNFSTAQTFSTNGIKLAQATGSTNYYATLQGDASVTSNITLTLPSSTGTIALVSDIPSTSNFVTLSGTQTITGSKTFTTAQTFGEIVLSNINYSLNTGQFNDEFAWGHGKFLVEDIGDRTLINVNTDGDLEFPNGATANNICLSYEEDSSSDGSDGMLENIGDELYFNGDSVSGKIHTISLSGGSHSIWPNIYYILTGTSFTFTLLSGTAGILSEYMGEITTTAGTTLNFTGVTWIASGDNITVSGSNLTLASGHTYQFSIVSNCGLIVEF